MSCTKELIAQAKAGDQAAKKLILNALEGIIVRLCVKFAPDGRPAEDALQEARLAVLIALEKFDSAKKASFSTYAYHFIFRHLSSLSRSERRHQLSALPDDI